MFLRRSLAHVNYFFFSVGTFGGLAPPPPPQYQKAGYASDYYLNPGCVIWSTVDPDCSEPGRTF